MLKYEKGSLLDVTEGIICHQVNCQRVAGKGLALAIRNKYPEWYKEFKTRRYLFSTPFGECWIYKATDSLFIASLYAQHSYGNDRRHTDYEEFAVCLEKLLDQTNGNIMPIYFPLGIGCRNAGGNWNIIRTMIEEYIPNAIIKEYK